MTAHRVASGRPCVGSATLVLLLLAANSQLFAEQVRVPSIEQLPRQQEPFLVRDWKSIAVAFDQLAFDTTAKGTHLPLIEVECTPSGPRFRMSAYVGDYRLDETGQRPAEAIPSIGSVLCATFVGIDKSSGQHNWVHRCRHFFAEDPGQRVFLNKFNTTSGSSFWYDLFPGILSAALSDRYPQQVALKESVNATARRWQEAANVLTNDGRSADFRYTGFDFAKMEPVANGTWVEPDAAAGIAWLQYMAYQRAREAGGDSAEADSFLQSTKWCLDYLEAEERNPAYEVLMPFGAYVAARVNAEQQTQYDVAKLVRWCFVRSNARPDMIMISDRWAEHDVHGLLGFTKESDPSRGYAFTMNTFAAAWPLVPLVRYDDRFARAIGRWMLSAANTARYFYSDAHPDARQSCYRDSLNTQGVVAYEGLRNKWLQEHPEQQLFASGDPLTYHWGPKTDLSLYGSAFVGVFGGIISSTNHERILQLDLRATDTWCAPSFPSYLIYNPYTETKEVTVRIPHGKQDAYDCVTNRMLAREATGQVQISVPPDEAVVLVLIPSEATIERRGSQLTADGVVVDFHNDTYDPLATRGKGTQHSE